MVTRMKKTGSKIFPFWLFKIALFLSLTLFFHGIASGALWYVNGDISTSGDGANWNTAFLTIQEAVSTASEGDEIWVKKGTYLLSSQINVGKAAGIYGGFSGNETQREQRDWERNLSITAFILHQMPSLMGLLLPEAMLMAAGQMTQAVESLIVKPLQLLLTAHCMIIGLNQMAVE